MIFKERLPIFEEKNSVMCEEVYSAGARPS
jgi:hypothetical protein